jgi:hypothetical protein
MEADGIRHHTYVGKYQSFFCFFLPTTHIQSPHDLRKAMADSTALKQPSLRSMVLVGNSKRSLLVESIAYHQSSIIYVPLSLFKLGSAVTPCC